jgi:hypothetical protein
MKFCQPHWDALRAAIEARGLGGLVAANGRDAHARMVAELKGTDEPADFDPLMSAHWMIVNRALEMGGLYLMTGDYCPICEVLKHHPADCGEPSCTPETLTRYWIDGPAEAALVHAREAGLL